MKHIATKVLGLALVVLFGQCSEDSLDVNNPNEINEDEFFQNINQMDLALNSVYSSIKTYDLYGADLLPKVLYGLPKIANQDWLGTGSWNQLYRNEITSDNDLVRNFWRAFYRGVARSNDFLTNADIFLTEEEPSAEDAARVEEMKGEVHFMRAFHYFHLIRLWGEDIPARNAGAQGVPLITGVAQTREEMAVSRATVDAIYQQVIADLQEAESRLPDSWEGSNLARVDAFAAKAMLGEVYMFYEDYATAQGYFEDVINNGGFSLVPMEEYQGMFNGANEFSEESIFEINFATDLQENAWQGGVGTNLALQISPKGTGWSNVYPHDVNILRFGDDPRLRKNALEPGVDVVAFGDGTTDTLQVMVDDEGAIGWSFRKHVPTDYSVYETNRTFGANFVVTRLADIYLLYAEVLNAQGNDAPALEYLNKVRRRAFGLDPNTPDATADFALAGTELRDAIREERFLELFAEGHRWYDIIRWGIVEEELARYPSVRSGTVIFNPWDYYLPIPQNELDANSAMSQSAGY